MVDPSVLERLSTLERRPAWSLLRVEMKELLILRTMRDTHPLCPICNNTHTPLEACRSPDPTRNDAVFACPVTGEKLLLAQPFVNPSDAVFYWVTSDDKIDPIGVCYLTRQEWANSYIAGYGFIVGTGFYCRLRESERPRKVLIV